METNDFGADNSEAGKTEKYNKLHLLLWVLLSGVTLLITSLVLLDPLIEIYDNMSIWFLFLFFCSEVIGAILSNLVVNHISKSAILNLQTRSLTMNIGSILYEDLSARASTEHCHSKGTRFLKWL